MPYYSKVNQSKTRGQKRSEAEKRGGFDDEGTRYSSARKSASGDTRKSGGADSRTKRAPGKAQASGEPRTYTRKPEGGAYGQRSNGRPQANGEPRSYSRNAAGGEPRPYARKADGSEPRSASRKVEGGAPRSYSRKPDGAQARPYARKTASGEPRSYSRKADGSAPRPYVRKTADGDAYPKRTGGRAQSDGELRFAPKSVSPYRQRGVQITPKPYNEQRREYKQAYKSPDYYANRTDPSTVDDTTENLLSGRNPIREALKSGRDIEKLLVAKGELSGSAKEIVAMARQQRVPVQEVDRSRLDAITPNHQGMLAFASAYKYHSVEDMLELAKSRNEQPFLVMLDGVTDPHNLGAVIRTAECAGAHGVIVQERRAVGLTPAAVKASAGAIEHLMVSRVTNLTATLDMLKNLGIWTYAADSKGEDYLSVDYSGGVVIVIGAEGEGVSRLVMEKCDKSVALPIRGKIDSLNASVAAGILLYAVLRSR